MLMLVRTNFFSLVLCWHRHENDLDAMFVYLIWIVNFSKHGTFFLVLPIQTHERSKTEQKKRLCSLFSAALILFNQYISLSHSFTSLCIRILNGTVCIIHDFNVTSIFSIMLRFSNITERNIFLSQRRLLVSICSLWLLLVAFSLQL